MVTAKKPRLYQQTKTNITHTTVDMSSPNYKNWPWSPVLELGIKHTFAALEDLPSYLDLAPALGPVQQDGFLQLPPEDLSVGVEENELVVL